VSEINGILHFLVQAKIEPGNVNGVQLSPTLQATRSNITRQHGGRAPKYLNYFTEPSSGKVIIDQLQTEQGSRFLGKRNRNMIVECLVQPPQDPDFLWLTLGQLKQLAEVDNVLNMDLRTVISSIPIELEHLRSSLGERRIWKGEQSSSIVSSDTILMSWLVQLRSESVSVSHTVGLNQMSDWTFSDDGIVHRSQSFFDVVFSQVTISNREVATWGQPIIRPRTHGLICFFVTERNDEIFFLVQAKSECGGFEKAELTSTLCFAPCKLGSTEDAPPFYELFLSLQEDSFLIDTLQSEEGGRFHQEQNRNCIVDVSKHFNFEEPLPAQFKWFSHSQLMKLIMHSNYLSIQARSLLAIVR
jgi:oxidase EvaA